MPQQPVARLKSTPLRWIIGQLEPLTIGRTMTRLESDCVRWCTANPTIAPAWFAGMVWQILATLPADDPWRQIAVRGRDSEGRIVERGQPPEGRMGAWLHGSLMDSEEPGTDLTPRSSLDVSLDHGLVALNHGISERGAQVLGFGFDSFEAAAEMLKADAVAMAPELFGRSIFDAGSAALRWALWRRRVYVGRTDPYPLMVALEWLERAGRVSRGESIDLGGCEFEISTEKIEDTAWSELSGLVGGHPLFPQGF